MTDRPILFSGPMVRAILSGAKTETRRVVKPAPSQRKWLDLRGAAAAEPAGAHGVQFRLPGGSPLTCVPCPYGVPGDRLWVKETWMASAANDSGDEALIGYRADDTDEWRDITGPAMNHDDKLEWCSRWVGRGNGAWQPSIYMPRWASRLTLAVEAVRVERLHEIDDAGARAEGVADREAYRVLWCDINGAESWDVNPWVWVVEFKRAVAP